MNLKKEDISQIIDVGTLNGDKVKLLKTWGGLNVLVGKKTKHSKEPDTLAAASHRGLALYQLEKEYGSDFQPNIMKSESEQIENIKEYSSNLSDNLNIFSLEKNNNVDFVVAKNGIILSTYNCEIQKNEIKLTNYKSQHNISINQEEVRNSIKNAIVEFATAKKLEININGK